MHKNQVTTSYSAEYMNRIPLLCCSVCARVVLSVLSLCRLSLVHFQKRETHTGNFVFLVYLGPMDSTIVSAKESGGPESVSTVDNRGLFRDWHSRL